MTLRLGIVVVHYNTPDDLGRCLESLRANPPGCSHEVVVIDNASTAPGLDELQTRFPEVRWVRNAENVGYGRACNQGMALLPADFHLILNPDIVVLPGSLDTLVDFAAAHPRAGLVGPQLLNEDGSVQDSCRRFYTFRTLLLRRTVLGKLLPNSRVVARHLMHDFDHQHVRPVDWVLGGCLLVRREALDRCGPMDDRFFLYFEDVDWCYRMWQCGYEVLYLPDARFVHRHRRLSARRTFSRSFWQHLTSLIAFYEKWSLLVYVAKKWRRPVEVVLHWALDMALLGVAVLGAYGLRWLAGPLFDTDLLRLSWYAGWFGWSAVMVTVAFALMGRYGSAALRRGLDWSAHLRQIGMVALLLLAGSYLGREEVVSRAVLVAGLGLYTVLSAWALRVVHRLHRRLERGYLALERTLLVGEPGALDDWLAEAGDPRAFGVDVVGYVSAQAAGASARPALRRGEVPWLGRAADLPDLVDRFRVSQVALWQRPGEAAVGWTVLQRLRQARIRLRWILDEAWLLAVGARADGFGPCASGVLDPDDGQTFRRWALRPLEVVVALPLLLASLLLAPWRRWRRAQGRLRAEEVAAHESGARRPLTIEIDHEGRPLPLWWQHALLVALLQGRVGLTGAPLLGPAATDDPSRSLRDPAAARPGLTGRWAREGRHDAAAASPWLAFFKRPGGWAPSTPADREAAPRELGEEVRRP